MHGIMGVFTKSQEKFGFIQRSDGSEMFVLPGSCDAFDKQLPPVGTIVKFSIVVDQKTNRLRAEWVEPLGRNTGRMLRGQAKFGFILQDDGEEMFVLPNSCPAFSSQLPPVGTRVSYEIVLDDLQGQPMAYDVQPEPEPSPEDANKPAVNKHATHPMALAQAREKEAEKERERKEKGKEKGRRKEKRNASENHRRDVSVPRGRLVAAGRGVSRTIIEWIITSRHVRSALTESTFMSMHDKPALTGWTLMKVHDRRVCTGWTLTSTSGIPALLRTDTSHPTTNMHILTPIPMPCRHQHMITSIGLC